MATLAVPGAAASAAFLAVLVMLGAGAGIDLAAMAALGTGMGGGGFGAAGTGEAPDAGRAATISAARFGFPVAFCYGATFLVQLRRQVVREGLPPDEPPPPWGLALYMLVGGIGGTLIAAFLLLVTFIIISGMLAGLHATLYWVLAAMMAGLGLGFGTMVGALQVELIGRGPLWTDRRWTWAHARGAGLAGLAYLAVVALLAPPLAAAMGQNWGSAAAAWTAGLAAALPYGLSTWYGRRQAG